MKNVHDTAIIDPKATIEEDCKIGPFTVVGPNVHLKKGCKIHSHVVLDGYTEIGQGSEIFPFASIGTIPQDLKFKGEKSKLLIGQNCKIREHVTMNPGTEGDKLVTQIGDNCLFMVGAHVAHDCIVGDNVIVANNGTLAGHVKVGNNVLVGGVSAIHQFVRIGDFAVIGGMSAVDADILPYTRVKGDRAYMAGLNLIGLERNGFDRQSIKTLQKATNDLFNSAKTLKENINIVEDLYKGNELVQPLINFVKTNSDFPLCRPRTA